MSYNAGVIRRGAHRQPIPHYSVGVEKGLAGARAAWSLDFPGCYAFVPAGADLESRMSVAILEFLAWSHNRSADRLIVEPHDIEVVQVVDFGADVASGESRGFFIHDAEPASQRDFPPWANPHDLAFDELRDLLNATPAGMRNIRVGPRGETLPEVVAHCATEEALYAGHLRRSTSTREVAADSSAIAALLEHHSLLQQVVCDVPLDVRTRQAGAAGQAPEEWSVRKVMRRSIWHLRYHTWEIRRAIAGIWLAP